MRPKVYVETTIVSYLTARTSRDLVTAAHQQVTSEWWSHRRSAFDLYASQFVVGEASAGDPEASKRRLDALSEIPLLAPSDEAEALAQERVKRGPVPERAVTDAAHIALAATHGMDYLINVELYPHRECRNAS